MQKFQIAAAFENLYILLLKYNISCILFYLQSSWWETMKWGQKWIPFNLQRVDFGSVVSVTILIRSQLLSKIMLNQFILKKFLVGIVTNILPEALIWGSIWNYVHLNIEIYRYSWYVIFYLQSFCPEKMKWELKWIVYKPPRVDFGSVASVTILIERHLVLLIILSQFILRMYLANTVAKLLPEVLV